MPHWREQRDISVLHWEIERSTVFQFQCFPRTYLVNYWWYTPRQRRKPDLISQFLDTFQQVDIMQVPIILDSVNDFAV